jgi:bifunctional DNA-binding transcriptional regulator/antitoxin component of YhaV-PrlF toxin-antitoxin module
MRLLSHNSREYKGKKYRKYWIIIPNKVIERLGWKSGEDLEAEVKHGKLVIEKD